MIIVTTDERRGNGIAALIYGLNNPAEITPRSAAAATLTLPDNGNRDEWIHLVDGELNRHGYYRVSPWQQSRGASNLWATVHVIEPELPAPRNVSAAPPAPRLNPELQHAVDALRSHPGESVSSIIHSAVTQFAALHAAELRGLRSVFTLRELMVMSRATARITPGVLSRQQLAMHVQDLIQSRKLESVFPAAESSPLLKKLHSLTPGQSVALSIALENRRADQPPNRGNQPAHFARVGLITKD